MAFAEAHGLGSSSGAPSGEQRIYSPTIFPLYVAHAMARCGAIPWSSRGGRPTDLAINKLAVGPVGGVTRYPLTLPPTPRLRSLATPAGKLPESHLLKKVTQERYITGLQ